MDSGPDDAALKFRRQRWLSLGGFLILALACATITAAPKKQPATRPSASAATTRSVPPKDDRSAPTNPEAAPSPKWIWGPKAAVENEDRYFRLTFDAKMPTTYMAEDPSSAWVWAGGDDVITVFLNGTKIAGTADRQHAVVADVRAKLKPGKNVLAVKCHNNTNPAAIALKLEIRGTYREPLQFITDAGWKTSNTNPKNWRDVGFDDSTWEKTVVVADYGAQPWGKLTADDPTQATPVEDITLPAGFKAELIYNVPKASQGSWVSMTPDPKGRLYVSDQAGSLFRVTPGSGSTPTNVEPVDLDIGQAQGLCWAFDSLYVVVNSMNVAHESGLYRLRDTDGDDKLDDIATLKTFSNRGKNGPGWGEHGPHGVVLGPDNKLYIVAGNFTNLPDGLAPTSPAQNWSEDLLLQRMTDGKGHDPTIYAPASWVCRTDENGKTWENISVGMRNAYDIAFNPDGELFTFDSDMEWDIGSPWYRPIRVCHVVSGGEYGWRNGSAKWPTYYLDSIPPVVNIGMGSPTGVTFGTGAKFPAKYQRAFFASDWAYGKIYAVHTTTDGASYKAEFEPFIVGRPFDVTDCVINHDGAMYVTIGGRGTQSGLYRITYVGEESTAPAPPLVDEKAADARALRHKLESFHGHRDSAAIEFAWPHLESADRFIRYAARVAVEAQDPAEWTERAFTAKSPETALTALAALCRVGNTSLQPRILEALSRIDLKKLTHDQLLDALRVYELCLIRMGRPSDPATASAIESRLDSLFPAEKADVNHELCQLLVYLKSPKVIEKTLALLDKATTQEEQLFYVFQLRNIRDGWKPEQREACFKWLNSAQQRYTGGASYKLFLKNVRDDAIATLGDNEKVALADLLKPPMELGFTETAQTPARKTVKSWTMADLTPKLSLLKSGRSFESGKAAFAAVSCVKCHRFMGEGGASGPDISGVGNRFQPGDLLEAIVLPSKIISDQYQATEIVTKKKQVFVGTVYEENDDRVVLRPSPLSTQTETVAKKEIAKRSPSKVSLMPQGLIDTLTEDEVLDLLAYLRAAGDPKDPAFKPITAGSTAAP